jgi:hypothetical protein
MIVASTGMFGTACLCISALCVAYNTALTAFRFSTFEVFDVFDTITTALLMGVSSYSVYWLGEGGDLQLTYNHVSVCVFVCLCVCVCVHSLPPLSSLLSPSSPPLSLLSPSPLPPLSLLSPSSLPPLSPLIFEYSSIRVCEYASMRFSILSTPVRLAH